MSKFSDCPVNEESPDPCPKCGATVKGNDPVNGICQAGATWDRATAAERERCAKIAEAHKGAAARKRLSRGQKLHMAVDGYEEIVAEERGEDIAAEIIAREIRRGHG